MMPKLDSKFAFAGLLLVGASCAAGASGAASIPPDQLKAADGIIEEAIGVRSLPGAALAISVDGKLVASRTFGVSDVDTSAPVTRTTLFRLGSISKLVTAAAVMRLVESGKLRLSDRVFLLLKDRSDVAPQLGSVTVQQLLNHTSGLADLSPQELGELVKRNAPIADEHVVAALQRPALSPPGQTWSYNNVGFRLLSWVVEDSTGQRFNDYIVSELAPALNLKSLQPCDLAQSRMSRGYIASEGRFVTDPSYSVRGLLGDGGLCASVEDLALLPARLIENKWIGPSTIAAMTRPTSLPDGTIVDYGLGVRRGVVGNLPLWGHTGSGLAGGWAAVAHYPDRRTTIAVVGNGSGGTHDAISLQAKVASAMMQQHGLRNEDVDGSIRGALPIVFEGGETRVCYYWGPTGVIRRSAGSAAPPRTMLHQGSGVFARSDYPLDRYVIQVVNGRPLAHRVYYDGFFAELLRPEQSGSC